jgi:broad specificity phosphatase PhoE
VAVAVVDVQVKGSNAARELQKVNNQAKQLDASVKGVGRSTASATANIQRFGIAFRSVLGPIVAITGAINLVSRSLNVLGERQADAAALENGLRKLGASSSELRRLVAVADELGKATLFNEEDFTKGFALLTSFQSIAVGSYERVAKAAADVAQVTGQDVSGSLLQLAKALQDPVLGLSALARSGTQFTKEQKEVVKGLVEGGKAAEAQNFILKEIEKQYGNAAKAAGSAGYAGAVDSLQESFRDFQERLAQGVQPAVTKLLGGMSSLFDLVSKIPKPVGQLAIQVGVATAAFIALRAAIQSVIATRIITFITQQIALYQTFGAAIYGAAAAQGALAAAVNLVKVAMVGLPFALVASAIAIYINDVQKAEEHTRQFEAALKSNSSEQVDAALKTEMHTNALIRQRLEQDKLMLQGSGKRGGGFAMLSAQKELEQSNSRILKLRDALSIAAEKEEAAYQSTNKIQSNIQSKAKGRADISARQLELEAQLLEAQKRKDVQEQAYLEKLIAREQIASQEMKPRERMLAFLQSEFQYSDRIKQIRQDIADIMAGAAVGPSDAFSEGVDGSVFTKGFNESKQHADELKKKLENLVKPLEQVKLMSGAVADAFSQGISGMVQGTVTAQQALAGFFRSVSQSFLNMATEIIKAAIRMMAFNIISSLFAGAPKFSASNTTAPGLAGKLNVPGILPGISPAGALASGGTATGGKSYLVGEKGPELFTPGRTGSVTPNNAISGVQVGSINITVENTGDQLSPAAQKQIANQVQGIVMSTLVNERRSGGVLR